MFVGPTNAKRTDKLLYTASSCKTMYTLIKVYNRELLRHREFKFSNYLHGDSSASCIKPLVLVPDIQLCKSCRKPGKTRIAAAFPAVFTRDGPTVAASYNKRCEECKITYYYSYSDIMDADGKSKTQYCPNSVKRLSRRIPSEADTSTHNFRPHEFYGMFRNV